MKIDRRISGAHQIYEHLRTDIINLTLKPGSVISKKETAFAFGTSQTPVRDALLRLEAEGLVDIVPQSKTTVSLIDIQHAREVHFLRQSVEIEVVRTLCSIGKGQKLEKLEAWVERQKIEMKAGDLCTFRLADNNFHTEMFRMAGVEGLMVLIDSRRGHYDRIRELFLRKLDRRQPVIEEHCAIIKAIRSGKLEKVEEVVRIHLGKSLAIIDEIKDSEPDYFI